MLDTHIFDISRVIQLAIAPVFLLTAIATIINVLIGRLARAVDRRRTIEEQLPDYVPDLDEERRDHAVRELQMIQKRVELILWAVALAVLAALLVCLLIGTAFAGAFISLDLSRPVAILFIAAVLSLTFCLLLFLREISIAAMSARQTVSPHAARAAFK
jgi:small-conductance mechanosensitive channel